jgi:HEAT repeat protein
VRDFAVNTLQVELPSGFLEHWTDGQALLLLDGLDEVAEDATRGLLVEKINCFLEAHSENWAVVTSRPWGYRRDYFRTEAYPHFELELFDEKQIQEFIEHWYGSRCDNAAQAQEMVRDLQDALKSKDRLQALVKNPLLLTMVALIHRYQDTLPKRRYKLYDKAVDTLLKSWERIKGKGETYGEFKHLDREDDLRRVMSLLARWIHTQYETQTTESGTLIEEVDLLAQLSHIIRQEYPQVKPHQAEGEAERFVKFIRDRAGLLNEYGRGRYAFVHKTFQEYLTAEAILKEAEYEDDSEIIYTVIQTHLHNPHWREVLLLLVGQLQGKKAEKAIERVLQHNSPYEQWLHRDLLFAGRCLTEDPEKLATAAPELVSEILQKLVELETFDDKRIGSKVSEEIFEILCWLKETAFETEALAQLKASKDHINQYRFLHLQALLGEREISLAAFLTLLKHKSLEVRYRAANALGKLGDFSKLFLSGLLMLISDEKSFVRDEAVTALGKLGRLSELLALIKDEDSNIRSSAASGLGSLGNRSEIVVSELLALLKDESSSVRSSAASSLGGLGNRSEIVVSELLALLKDESSSVRSSAVSALVNLGNRSEIVVSEILMLLKDESSSVRSNALFVLGDLGDSLEIKASEVLALLKDESFIVRYSAVLSLGRLGNCSEIVASELLAMIKDESSDLRSIAAFTLGTMGERSETVILGLLTLLKDEASSVRANAVSALVLLGDHSEIVVSELLLLLKDESSGVRFRAASALKPLVIFTPALQSTLVQWIEQHSELPHLGSAIDALWQICD